MNRALKALCACESGWLAVEESKAANRNMPTSILLRAEEVIGRNVAIEYRFRRRLQWPTTR